jgi:predicted DNA-binding protein (UPF0251 family)
MPASLRDQIEGVREQIREKELEILDLKQKLRELKEKRAPSKMNLCEETYIENIHQPRPVLVRMFVNEHNVSVVTASSYYSAIKQRVARLRSAEEAEQA